MENTIAPDNDKKKGRSIIKKLGWAGFFFFLIKGVSLYIVLPALVYFGVVDGDFFSSLWEKIQGWFR